MSAKAFFGPCLVPLVLLALGCGERVMTISASAETQAVATEGDAADDIAIWVHPTQPADSLIIGTDKRGGLSVYDLEGREIQCLPEGPSDNVDLREDFPFEGQGISLVAATHTRSAEIGFYRVDVASRRLLPVARVGVDDFRPVGMCLYRSAKDGTYYLFASDRKCHLRQWEVRPVGGAIELHTVRNLTFGSHIEACATDDLNGKLYVSEEDVGVWCLDAEPDAHSSPVLVDDVKGGRIEADLEGLAVVPFRGGGLLVVSSQKRDQFAAYRTEPPFEFVGTFRIGAGDGIDEVTHTDGLDISVAGMGADFPGGLMVVQDDINDGSNQNFKLVRWELVVRELDALGPLRGPHLASTSEPEGLAESLGEGAAPGEGPIAPMEQ